MCAYDGSRDRPSSSPERLPDEAMPGVSTTAGIDQERAETPRQPGEEWKLRSSSFDEALKNASAEPVVTRSRSGRFLGTQSAIDGYYQRQTQMIEGFSQMDTLEERLLAPTALERVAEARLERRVRFAINISNLANVFLLIAKVYVSVESGSLAIIASALDSLLDLLSGFILYFTARSMRKDNPYLYPIGKKRMQPLGIIVFASIMATLGFQIFIEGIRRLVGKNHNENLSKWQWEVGIMVPVTVTKLMLWLYCATFSNDIVLAYAKDHFFDVVTNVVSLAAALFAGAFAWWIDPAGAILLAFYTMFNWFGTVLENVNSLTGRTAPPEFLQKLTYLCWNHHEAIQFIDTVRAYTFGNHYFSEVDIVLPPDMPLKDAHDIGETLQYKIESLPEIERAFVHLDFEVSHRPEHRGLYINPLSSGIAAASDDSSCRQEL
eukprot:SM000013S26439  [mRNA]  locus=s13:391614:393778:+ [translate_table: standard]